MQISTPKRAPSFLAFSMNAGAVAIEIVISLARMVAQPLCLHAEQPLVPQVTCGEMWRFLNVANRRHNFTNVFIGGAAELDQKTGALLEYAGPHQFVDVAQVILIEKTDDVGVELVRSPATHEPLDERESFLVTMEVKQMGYDACGTSRSLRVASTTMPNSPP